MSVYWAESVPGNHAFRLQDVAIGCLGAESLPDHIRHRECLLDAYFDRFSVVRKLLAQIFMVLPSWQRNRSVVAGLNGKNLAFHPDFPERMLEISWEHRK
ncbi:MAG: hypothetical protein IPL65_09580 [Lewinellaceae bacterium]|nr:hypothetical protein [Lewinellaceae bacterium]